jgi:hypothetical protein
MPTAYILVFCEPGCEAAVVDELRTLTDAARIYGSSYDIMMVRQQTYCVIKSLQHMLDAILMS